ncbi:MAG: hypothetical protein ACFB16_26785 [Phormidesmis sp.]
MVFPTTQQSDLGAVHQSNVIASLTRRLEIAKANCNQQLVTALEDEYEQLTAIAQPVSICDQAERLWVSFVEILNGWSMVYVKRTIDDSRQHSWYAYNPQAGQVIVANSKSGMRS